MTIVARKRAFAVGMVALAEEVRVCGMDKKEHDRRWRELWQDCFGDYKGSIDLDFPRA